MIDFKVRPLSWSAISAFEYDPEQWYAKYVLGEKQEDTAEMRFGKLVAKSFEDGKPLAPVTLYPVVEKKLSIVLDGIPLVGYLDTYDPETHFFREFKTGKKPWTQKRANEHGQLKMYALMLYVTYKVKPEDYSIHLDWIPTRHNGDFTISFVEPVKVHSFRVKLTMRDILGFALHIKETAKAMENYALAKSVASTTIKGT